MGLPDWISTTDVSRVFDEVVVELGGRVTELVDDGERLFARAVLPEERLVRRGDRLRGGVAVVAAGDEVRVCPYVFREVCSNGVVMGHSVWARRIELSEWSSDGGREVTEQVAEAVRACGAAEVFEDGVREMRGALELEAEFARTVVPLLDQLPAGERATMMGRIAGRFFGQPARSRFALMNAVAAVARDQGDPELRWRLEEIGGEVAGMAPVARRAVGMVVCA